MKIAWVTYDFPEYSAEHVNALAETHEVLLVMPVTEEGADAYDVVEAVHQHRFQKPRLRQPLKQFASVRELVGAIRAFDPDVVHWQQGHLWFNFALSAIRRHYPLVVTIHDPRHHLGDEVSKKTPQWIMDYGFRRADHVIVHGDPLAEQVHQLFGHDRHKIHTIPHVVMGAKHAVDTMEEAVDEVLFFGRIWEYKGLDYLIDAAPLIAEEVPDVKIVIAGEGEDFERYASRLSPSARFEVHNRWVDDGERASFFQRASVVVLPYLEATQSGVVPVAYSHAKPVVATDVGALAECVHHEQTGLLVPPRDARALADAVVRLLKSPDQRRAMGQRARELAMGEASPSAVAARTAEVYRQACRDREDRLKPACAPIETVATQDATTQEPESPLGNFDTSHDGQQAYTKTEVV